MKNPPANLHITPGGVRDQIVRVLCRSCSADVTIPHQGSQRLTERLAARVRSRHNGGNHEEHHVLA